MKPGGEGVTKANEGLPAADPARVGARMASSWIRALANAWEDDWSRSRSGVNDTDLDAPSAPSKTLTPG
jgi:hypothetical protein